MTKIKSTKRALLLSAVSLLLCASMFVGSTFAWFTDTVSSGRNLIQSGNLDIELEYFDVDENDWVAVDAETDVFGYTLWEPGHTRVIKFRVSNKGSLALKYQLTADVFNETAGKNKDNETFLLSDYLYTKVVDADATRDEILAITDGNKFKNSISMKDMGELVAEGTQGNTSEEIALAIWMPTSVGNEANHNGNNIPKIEFGINLFATQLVSEEDSFGPEYDKDAPAIEVATADELQEVLNDGGYAVLTADITAPQNKRFDIPAGTNAKIDLNGFTLTSKDGGGSNTMAIYIDKGAKLTLDDSQGTGKIVSSCYGVYVKQNAKFIMNGGTLSVSGNGVYDIGVSVWNAAFVMNGGAIESKFAVWASNYYKDVAGETGLNNCSVTIADGCTINSTGYADVEYADALDTILNVPEGLTLFPAAVSTAAELSEALAGGGYVTLAKDIELEDNTSIVIGSGVETTLNLSGHTISGENTRTATHNFMIDVKGGELTVTGGTISMQHTGTNMGWNGATTVIDVTAGGVLNLQDVTIENKGGTDMNFGVHLNNWGEVTLNADNCVFDATYCGVRVNNSGPDMNNVKITNSTLTGGTRAFWVHNYASSDFGGKLYSGSSAAYDKATVDERLNLDIYNNNNTFEITGTAISPIRYGFNESVYFDESGEEIVTASTQGALNEAVKNGAETVALGAGTYSIPTGMKNGQEVTIVGTKDTIINNTGIAYPGGSTVNFTGVTINSSGYGNGMGNGVKATYTDCTFNAADMYLYGSAKFINCTFNDCGTYALWTWGAGTAEFIGCTFNTTGKALYVNANVLDNGTNHQTVIITDCKFYDTGDNNTQKAAIETGDDYNKTTYDIIITNTVVEGFAVTEDKTGSISFNYGGNDFGTNVWGNKYLMGTDKLNVMIDGVDVH